MMIPPRYPIFTHPPGCECPSCRRVRVSEERCAVCRRLEVAFILELALAICMVVVVVFFEFIYSPVFLGVILLAIWWHSTIRRAHRARCKRGSP